MSKEREVLAFGDGDGEVSGGGLTCLTAIVFATRAFTLSSDRTSTWMGVASPPAEVISRATVVMVESLDFGLGALSVSLEGSVMDLAATTTR